MSETESMSKFYLKIAVSLLSDKNGKEEIEMYSSLLGETSKAALVTFVLKPDSHRVLS